jgi:hypothetical protein
MSIKIDGLGKLEISLQKRTDATIKAISETMQVNAEKIVEKIKRNAPNDRGKLSGGAAVEGENGSLKFEIFSGPAQYAWIMEFGSGKKYKGNGRDAIAAQYKGKPSGGTFKQFYKAMFDYIGRHGGFPDEVKNIRQKVSYAKSVAFRIIKNGLEPANGGTGYFFKQYDRQLPIIQRSLQMAIKKFSQ